VRKIASSITFLYFEDLQEAKDFFASTLGLEQCADQGWSVIWRTGSGFIGAVDVRKGSIPVTTRGGVLVSLNVDDVEVWHEKMKQAGVRDLTPIREKPEIGLRSFFFKGPAGYHFEIQEFVRPEEREVFLSGAEPRVTG
jgi:predicted enzyme related to lactoylglutathione lyase